MCNHLFNSLKEGEISYFHLSKYDVITYMTSNFDYDVIAIMTFGDCNVIISRLICMLITRVKYDFYCMTILHGK